MIKKSLVGQVHSNPSKTSKSSFFPPERNLKEPNSTKDKEEKNILNEFKIASAEKIKVLEEHLNRSEKEIQRKEIEMQRLKENYENEIACLQDYINLSKKPANKLIEEQLKNEKARSLTFFKALTRKKQEFDQTKEGLAKVKELETQITVLEEKLKKIEFSETDKKRESLIITSQKSEAFLLSDFQESVKKLKFGIKEKMSESISQVVTNFNNFNRKLANISEKIQGLERKQDEFQVFSERIKHLERSLASSLKENQDLQNSLEKNYKQSIDEMSSYEEEVKRQMKKIKDLSQENRETKQVYDEKIRKMLIEFNELNEKYLNLKEKNNEKETWEYDVIIQQLNKENAKLVEELQVYKKGIDMLVEENSEKNTENSKLKENIENNEMLISDLKKSLKRTENELKKLSEKHENQAKRPKNCSVFAIEKCLDLSILRFHKKKTSISLKKENEASRNTNKLLSEITKLKNEKQSNFDLVKSLEEQIQKLNSDKIELESDLSRVFKELKIANEVIFHNHKILDTSSSFTGYDSEAHQQELNKLIKKIESLTEDLETQQKKNLVKEKSLAESEKKTEGLLMNLKLLNDSLSRKNSELQSTQENLALVNSKFLDLKANFQSKTKQFEDLQIRVSEKEKENALNLNLIEKLEQKIQENEELLEEKTASIEELQEAVEQFKQEISEVHGKAKTMEKELEQSKQDQKEYLEFRHKINDLSRIAKDQDSINLTASEDSFNEIEEIKSEKDIKEILDQLVKTDRKEKRIEFCDLLIEKVKLLTFNHSVDLKLKLKSFKKINDETRKKNKDLIHQNDLLIEELNYLQEGKNIKKAKTVKYQEKQNFGFSASQKINRAPDELDEMIGAKLSPVLARENILIEDNSEEDPDMNCFHDSEYLRLHN